MDEISIGDVHHALQTWNDKNLVDPRVQIGGVCHIFDLSNIHRDNVIKMFDSKIGKVITKYYQVCTFANSTVCH